MNSPSALPSINSFTALGLCGCQWKGVLCHPNARSFEFKVNFKATLSRDDSTVKYVFTISIKQPLLIG